MGRENIRLYETAYPVLSLSDAISITASQQLQLHSVAMENGNAATIAMALLHSCNNYKWKVWTVTASDAEVTSDIQAGTTINMFPTTNDYGLIIQNDERFNMVAFNISQEQTGSPVYVYQYYNGSSWTTLPLLNSPVYTATGKMVILFAAPLDWAVGDGSNSTDDTKYSIKITASTAPSQAVQVNELKVCKTIAYRQEVADNGVLILDMGNSPLLLQQGETVIPYFSTANAANRLEIAYKLNP